MPIARSFYYALKPYLPWGLRMGVRRVLARRKRTKCGDIWPIDPAAAPAPPGWSGWPDQRRFAFVLTHDVEGPEGLANCRALAELEMELGFRSCFNFIPEGSYRVPDELRAWLIAQGFEVGVHDLEHDGRLYASQSAFTAKAARINGYLRDWQATGFRSGFMLRNLDWLHHLGIRYDSSTFDTDPFEPQPDAIGTIFPFLVPAPEGASRRTGYVELPYTLPQDSTLFLLLREASPQIWLSKLDWIVQQGGMALVNVHPDYLAFPGQAGSSRTYPAAFYSELLRHVASRFAGQYWQPVPGKLADWYRQTYVDSPPARLAASVPPPKPSAAPVAAAISDLEPDTGSHLRGKRAAVILYSKYPADPRPRRAAEALIDAGMSVDLLCLSEGPTEAREETVKGVRVFRVPIQHRREGKWTYIWQYTRFFLSSFWFLTRRGFRNRYDVVHVHNMPDFLVFSAIVPRLRGAKLILDLHDPMPELMMTIFGIDGGRFEITLLKFLERMSLRFAHSVITVNEACRKIFSGRSCPAAKIHVVMNSPDEGIFRQHGRLPSPPPAGSGQPFVFMYHGSLVERHGLDLAVTALERVRVRHPHAELRIYGQRTPFLEKTLRAVEGTELASAVRYFGPKKLDQIVEAIGECHVGVIPNRRSIFTEINTPTRIFEYLSQSRPVIAPRAPGILDYFAPDDLVYFELGDADDLARKFEHALSDWPAVEATVERGVAVYRRHCWSRERRHFVQMVGTLLGGGRRAPVPPRSSRNGQTHDAG